MGIQYSFKRYEKKYILTEEQFDKLKAFLMSDDSDMKPDGFGLHTVRNIYYDTETNELIRTSIEKPIYKEKFRIRSYGNPDDGENVYAEIKKKYEGIVYKRRIAGTYKEVEDFMQGKDIEHENPQIMKEIKWFLTKNKVEPRVFIGYDREAFLGKSDSEFRLTFDHNLRWRTDKLDLRYADGKPILPDSSLIVMEVKVRDAIPLWFARKLSELKIYPRSVSKYGSYYKRILSDNTSEDSYMLVEG